MAKPSKRRFELSLRHILYKEIIDIDKIENVDVAAMKKLKNNLKKLKDSRIK